MTMCSKHRGGSELKKLIQKALTFEDLRNKTWAVARPDYGLILEHFELKDIDLDGEARYVDIPGVVMVFDLAGSSLSIRQSGPKQFVDRYASVFDTLTTVIYEHKGIIEKFPGDGISAHFLKLEGEDSLNNVLTRAVKASKEIQSTMNNKGHKGQFRISMWSGEDTIATIIGNRYHRELISVGHPVNVAHKIEKLIKDNGCVIGMDESLKYRYESLFGPVSGSGDLPVDIRSKYGEKWYGVK